MTVDADTRELSASLRGELILPADVGYDTARAVWNGAIDRRPAVIVRAADAADAATTIRFAREQDTPLSVRGAGHGVSGYAVADGGVLLDLSLLNEVHVDPAQRSARAGPGVTWAHFDRETHACGLATTGGVVSAVGIAGLTLGGGLGWLLRKHGMVIDNLLSADVVTADGQLVTASADSHPDLFWALRGGGGNFGVVTSFQYRLHPLTHVIGGLLIHSRERARDGLRFFRDFVRAMPDDIGLRAVLLTTPEGQPAFGFALSHSGPIEAAHPSLAALRGWGPPEADLVRTRPYPELQNMLDAAAPRGLHNYWRSGMFAHLTDDLIDLIVEHANRAPSVRSSVQLDYYGGAASRLAPQDTAYPHRAPLFGILISATWANAEQSEANIVWARELGETVRVAGGDRLYSNQMMADEQDRVRDAYGVNYDRLVQVKTRYDPTNLFRPTLNISPSGQ